MPQIAKVAVSAANYAIDKPYDYLLPDGTDAAVGSRVLVPFGRGNRLTEGMILSLERKTPEKALKAVREVLEPEPVCSEREIRLALWMRQRYFCTFYDAIRTILPAGVWYRYRQFWKLADYAGEDALSEKEKPLYALLSRGEQELETLAQAVPDAAALLRQMEKKGLVTSRTEGSRRVGDRVVKLASLAIEPEEAQTRMERKRRTAPRQCDAVDFLTRCAETSVHDLCYFTGVTAAGLRSLEKAGIIALRAREEYRIAPRTAPRAAEAQRRAADGLPSHACRVPRGRGRGDASAGRDRQRQDPCVYPPCAGAAARGEIRDDSGAGDCAHAADDGAVHGLFRRGGGAAAQWPSPDRAL